MINHIRTIVGTAAATAVLVSGLGLAAAGVAGAAEDDICVDFFPESEPYYCDTGIPISSAESGAEDEGTHGMRFVTAEPRILQGFAKS